MTGPRLALLTLLLLLASPLPAQDAAHVEAELEALRERIAAIGQALDTDRARRDQELDALARIERDLARIGRDLETARQDLARIGEEIDQLESRRAQIRAELADQEGLLGDQLRAAYQLGARSRLKTLLNQDDPRSVTRLMAWHGYLSRARVELMSTLAERLAELSAVASALDTRRDELAAIRSAREASLSEQQAARARRAEQLTLLERRIDDREAERDELRAAAEELETLLKQLADALADIPPEIEAPALESLRGQLPMPAQGPLKARFGDRRRGEVTWSGWLIGAEPGSRVHAVAHGRIAYADWLRGYGMMVIIEHGDGYMSLYGHNEALLADVGDWVGPGEVIALAGSAEGEAEAGLYFELRKDGRPVNPAAWIAR